MSLYSIFQQNKPEVQSIAARIMVIGVGGAGGNSVDYIWTMGIKGVNLLICNTDIKALEKSPLKPHQKICMGDGKGAGNDAKVGEEKAKESLDEIRQYILANKPDMIFLTAGMGGGTGTGATPVIAKMIHQLDIPTIAILTTPSRNEGTHRYMQAKEGIDAMADSVDTFIFLRNETIIELYKHLPVHAAFNKGNDVVALAAKGIADIALTQSDLVSVDISDVCKVIRHSRCAVMGMACATGEKRVEEAINMAILSPLFGGISIEGAESVLINFATSSPDKLIMSDVNDALNYIQRLTRPPKRGYTDNTSIIWGTSIKPELDDQIEIIIVVSGFPQVTDVETEFLHTCETQSAPQIDNAAATAEEKSDTTDIQTPPAEEEVETATEEYAADRNSTTPTESNDEVTETPNETNDESVENTETEAVDIPARPNTPIMIPKSTRSYYEIQNYRSTPAYKRRQYKLITEIQGKGNVVESNYAENVADEVAESDSTTQQLF